MSNVTDAEIDAGVAELLHDRNSLGDGCFGCGYGGWWGNDHINNRMHLYRILVKNVLEAVKQHQAQSPQTPAPVIEPAPVLRRRPKQEADYLGDGTDA